MQSVDYGLIEFSDFPSHNFAVSCGLGFDAESASPQVRQGVLECTIFKSTFFTIRCRK